MSPLRTRMLEDMRLAGLSAGTQANYIQAVRKLAAHYRRSPDQLSEAEVRSYLVRLRDAGVARGTFKTNHYGVQFLYRQTLDRDWPLFCKKRFASRSRSACPTRSPISRSASCWAA
ncbi:MAG TPA: site-specific integrase [Candidatus Acidoferrum sp.]|jgi:hypothetical protein|nr:site-specific integrase [Candidatus Acidoferrum sp.]